jgi:hypothetical protein
MLRPRCDKETLKAAAVVQTHVVISQAGCLAPVATNDHADGPIFGADHLPYACSQFDGHL